VARIIRAEAVSPEEGAFNARELFIQAFGYEPEGVWSAPGRVNVIGDDFEPFADKGRAFGVGGVEIDGKDHRFDTGLLEYLAVSLLPQVVNTGARSQQRWTTRPSLEQVLGGDTAAGLVVAADIGHRGGELPIHTDHRQMNRAVVGQAVVVSAGDDAVNPVRDQQVEVLELSVRLAHGVADERPIATVGQEILDVLGELAEEG